MIVEEKPIGTQRPSARRFLSLFFYALLTMLVGAWVETLMMEESYVSERIEELYDLAFVMPDSQYLGQTPEYVDFHKILTSEREMSEEEEDRLVALFYRKRTHVDPATSELITDMYGSIIHRFDLSGTKHRITRDGDVRIANRKQQVKTSWGYDPAQSFEKRRAAMNQLLLDNLALTPERLADLKRLITHEDSHVLWRFGHTILEYWERDGHFKNTQEYLMGKWSKERMALDPLLYEINKPPFRYHTDDDAVSRLMAVKHFIEYHRSLNIEDPGEMGISWRGLSDLLVIHQWEEDYRVSKAAWEMVRYGSTIQGIYLDWSKELHWIKDELQPPFPWGQVEPRNVYEISKHLDQLVKSGEMDVYGADAGLTLGNSVSLNQ